MIHSEAPGPYISTPRSPGADRKWLRWGYIFVGIFFLTRLIYIVSGRIELSEDEAYQWLWSKHLALSYYSKPPLIAYLQFLGTSLWGDTEFGIRFFSPVLAALLSILLLKFMAGEGYARAGFWLIAILGATPLMALGSTLLTVDAPSVFFWVAAMIAGWTALRTGRLLDWCLLGLCLGLGLLSKYTAIVQIISLAIFFAAWRPARERLRTPGPYLAVGISLLAFLPVIFWNIQHHWITVTHLAERGGLDESWKYKPSFMVEFLLSEFGLLNPVFFGATLWAGIVFWRKFKHEPLLLYLFCLGTPLFVFYFLFTIRGRALPNWIAPSVVPLFALMAIIGDKYWRSGQRAVKHWLVAGLVIGYAAGLFFQATEVAKVVTGHYLPAKADPLHRVRGWREIATMLGREREKALAEGKPVFLIAQHYGLAGILSFYLPEAKKTVAGEPLVYYIKTDQPKNQFYFWPGYDMRKGQNAIYVEETIHPKPPPSTLTNDFAEVVDLGIRDAYYHGELFRQYQIYLCRNLR